MRRRARTDWDTLRLLVERALRRCGEFPASTRIAGRVRFLDAGLNHDNFVFGVEADDPLPHAEPFVFRRLLPRHGESEAPINRLHTEAETLRVLKKLSPDFDAPRFICFVAEPDGAIRGFIETALEGVPLRLLKNDADHRTMAIEAIGRVAAGVHRLTTAPFMFLPGHDDAEAHVDAQIAAFESRFLRDDPEAVHVMRWIGEHRSRSRPAALLHGDLLPQNLLIGLGSGRPGVIDWEYAQRGDPAYDLAIVTRGNRKLLGINSGLRRLLQAYLAAGGVPIEPPDVVVWELLLVLRWLYDALRDGERHGGASPESHRNQLRAILRRAPA
jgi:aminoglycoside phosphotransferase (APT) family kinase protein